MQVIADTVLQPRFAGNLRVSAAVDSNGSFVLAASADCLVWLVEPY
jgi:hypothetical protein